MNHQHKHLQDGFDGLEVCSWCRSSLSQQPLHTCYCHLRSSLVSNCSLQWPALYWFHTPIMHLDNEVSQSMDQPHGTVCH